MNNGDSPATKQDVIEAVDAAKQELRADMHELRAELRADMKVSEDRVIEAMRDMQTEMLKAFYGFTEGVQLHFKDVDHSEAGLRERLTSLETRVLEVERRLNTPPSN